MKINLHFYFGKIKISGVENIPNNKPVLFLPNHQSALLDVLLIATNCSRKPWFLTRSDVFNSKILISLFNIFQMIPIYRIRDGRESLKNNQAVFDRCSQLLIQKEALLMFPEANHNLKRRVRPLSKGFTRILFNTLDQAPETDIVIVPVGLNYKDAIRFPDRVAVNYGTPIEVSDLYNSKNEKGSIDTIKKAVSNSIKTLTTHIENEESYDETIKQLDDLGVNYLNAKEVNKMLDNLPQHFQKVEKRNAVFRGIGKGLFTVLNFPIVMTWKLFAKPKVWEDEFMGTLRVAFAVLAYPIYYGLIFGILSTVWSALIGFYAVLGVFLFNWIYVKSN